MAEIKSDDNLTLFALSVLEGDGDEFSTLDKDEYSCKLTAKIKVASQVASAMHAVATERAEKEVNKYLDELELARMCGWPVNGTMGFESDEVVPSPTTPRHYVEVVVHMEEEEE